MLSWLGRRLGASPGGAAPADPSVLIREAQAREAAGRLDQAERLLYRALALAPESAEVQLHLGSLFRAQGRHDAALQC